MANVWDTKPSNYNTDYGSNPVFSDVFKSGTQGIGYDWSSAPLQNINWNQTLTPARSDAPSWMDFGKAALDIASKWRGTSSSGSRANSEKMRSVSSPGSEVTNLGSGYTLINRAPVVKQKTSGGGGGFLGPVGSLLGAGVGALAGGPAGALAGASLGSGLGGAAGSLADRTFFG